MKLTRILFAAAVLPLLFSCKTKHDLAYFTDIEDQTQGILTTQEHTVTIEPELNLVIIVKSKEPAASAQFNLSYLNPAAPGTTDLQSTPKLQVYSVDYKGDIDFPVLGTIHVAGMTTYELKDYLTERLKQYIKDPRVTVSLQGYKISVIGEVGAPKTIYTSADRFSILDALASCGDLTQYARRDNILVMRRTADNQIEYGRLNLASSEITKSPYFWLKNNDMIVVEPNGIKQDNSKINQHNSYRLSVLSSILGICSIVASVVIATLK